MRREKKKKKKFDSNVYNDLHIEDGIERQGKMAFKKEKIVIKGQLDLWFIYMAIFGITFYLFIHSFFFFYFFLSLSLFVRNYLIEDIA